MLMTSMPSSGFRYALSLLAVVCVFALANYLHFHRHADCCDLFILYGLPFPVLLDGGSEGIRRILWPGVATDFLFVLATAGLIGNMWVRHSRRTTNKS